MEFTAEEIVLAKRLKKSGLVWNPNVGHYVWDEADIIKCESPFHDMVFYILDILDLKHLLRRAGTIERLRGCLCWLPTWFDARTILMEAGVFNAKIERLRDERAIETGLERIVLYRLIEESLAAKNSTLKP